MQACRLRAVRIRRVGVALLIGLVAGVLAAGLQVSQAVGPLMALEASAQDLALQARRPESYLQLPGSGQVAVTQDPRETIVLVSIDERTIGELGAYNGGYPRRVVADLVQQLLVAPPRTLGLDIGFFEQTADDEVLGQALDAARTLGTRVVLAGVGLGEVSGGGEPRYEHALLPVSRFAERADIGLSNVLPDERGTIRAMPLLAQTEAVERPTFGLAVAAAYLRRPRPVDARAANTLEIAGRIVPVDETTAVRINFFGSPYATFRSVSFVDVLRGRADPEVWRGRIVLVGASGAAGLADDYWTPVSVSRKMAGVEIHANVAATMLSTQFLRSTSLATQVLTILAVALVISVLTATLPVSLATVGSALLLGLTVAASLWALYAVGLQLPLANPVLGGVLSFMGVVAWRVAVEQRQARALQRALASVIPPSVAQQIARSPERVRLGGERRTITLLFTDLKDFTGFSETVPAEVVSRMVSDYLAAMTAVVFDYGGTVDKFVGDEVMAFWNAPLDDVAHARHACEAALSMQAALAELNKLWAEQQLRPQQMRIGLHTGPVSVGNMGTRRRFAYTALGDNVNLAARLEPLNKEYGTSICVSQATLDEAGSGFVVRFLDQVAVKGKRQPVGVYELLGYADSIDRSGLLTCYQRGVELYRAREFEAAADQFRLALEICPDDGPSAVYALRCEALIATPPAEDWDGVFVMQHK